VTVTIIQGIRLLLRKACVRTAVSINNICWRIIDIAVSIAVKCSHVGRTTRELAELESSTLEVLLAPMLQSVIAKVVTFIKHTLRVQMYDCKPE
jgi:hypothetical protein